MKPAITRWQADADAYAAKVKADAKNEIDLAKEETKGRIALQRLENQYALEDRAAARVSQLEARRQENLEAITAKAALAITDQSKPVDDKPVDPDWVAQFFNRCQDIGDEQMQTLWARILAGEVSQPGSFSRRTLAFVETMSRQDADLFTRFCSVVWETDGGMLYPFSPDISALATIPGIELQFDDFAALDTMGLIRFEGVGRLGMRYKFDDPDLNSPPPELFVANWSYHGRRHLFTTRIAQQILVHRQHPTATLEVHFDRGQVTLTKIGRELYPIAGGAPKRGVPAAYRRLPVVGTMGGPPGRWRSRRWRIDHIAVVKMETAVPSPSLRPRR